MHLAVAKLLKRRITVDTQASERFLGHIGLF